VPTIARLRQRPVYVLFFLIALTVPQVQGLVRQFKEGFRPFLQDPIRVPFSWDMFSNRVDRCIVTWDKPLLIDGHRLNSLRDVELPVEWDIILDYVPHYQRMAHDLCHYYSAEPNVARLQCFTARGEEITGEAACD